MRRYKVRFPSEEAFFAAQAVNAEHLKTPVASPRRKFIAVEIPLGSERAARFADKEVETLMKEFGAAVVEDVQYDMEADADLFSPDMMGPDEPSSPSMDDVLDMVNAKAAWATTRGAGVAIAIVDTGISGTRREFPAEKRVGAWQPQGDTPWTDWNGHGTMCATIAAGTRVDGGDFDGIAPEADLIACRTRFYDSELTAVYDYLASWTEQYKKPVVASNSFGMKTGTAPSVPADSDFLDALQGALDAGVIAVFSAGNYHDLAGGAADECAPTSIWLHKCRADVLTVATCKLDKSMWYYSSRGPGQHVGQLGMRAKPDVTAPTPENGRIVYGDGIQVLKLGWGTSGACPQVAGLAALLLSDHPGLGPDALRDAIRNTAVSLGHGPTCQGNGLIDCKGALGSVP